MKYVNVYAYFENNLGDDIMVETLIRRFPKVRFYTERDVKNSNLQKYSNFKSKAYYLKPENHKRSIFSKLFKGQMNTEYCNRYIEKIENSCACSVFIGGSVFMQRGSLSNEAVDMRIARNNSYLKRGPLFVIGANFGAYYTEYFKSSFESHLAKCKSITFRDKASYKMFSHLKNVEYAPDVVFGYDKIPRQNAVTNEIIISVVDISRKYGIENHCDKYETFVAELCDYVLSIGKTPVLMSFCKLEGDENAVERIFKKAKDSNHIKTYCYSGDIEPALQRIANAEAVIATRFHAMVLAIRMGKPFYALSYDTKINNVLDDMNCEAYCNVWEMENITPEFVFNNLKCIDSTQYEIESKKQFSQLEKFLLNKKR